MKYLFLIFNILLVIISYGATYYVSPDGSDTSPYDTWEKAATNVCTMTDIGIFNTNDIIYIADGEYQFRDFGSTYHNLIITNGNLISTGGYENCIFRGDPTFNGQLPVRLYNVNVSGVTFTEMREYLSQGSIYGDRCMFSNCYFLNNKKYGCLNIENCGVYDCTFKGNRGYRGGAIKGSSNITIVGSSFISNLAVRSSSGYRGGAVYISKGGTLISNCVFNGNCTTNTQANCGGAHLAFYYVKDNIVIKDCIFINATDTLNSGIDTASGSVYIGGFSGDSITNIRVSGCMFSNNISGGRGAGLCIDCTRDGCKFFIEDCDFYNNVSSNTSYSGDGGLTVFSYSENTVTVNNCKFISNESSTFGGGFGLFRNSHYPHINASYILAYSNRAPYAGAGRMQGSLNSRYSHMTLVHNHYDSNKYAYRGRGTTVNSIVACNYCTNSVFSHSDYVFEYCCVDSNIYYRSLAGSNNVTNESPRFVSSSDFHLKSLEGTYVDGEWVRFTSLSPCIDAGNPSDSYIKEPKPSGYRVNMGYYGNTAEASKSLNTNRESDKIIIPSLNR